MNILILSWRDIKHPNAGGAEQVMHEHAKGWISTGYDVTLFSSFFSGGKAEEDMDGVHIIRRGGQLLEVQIRAFFWYLFGEHKKFNLVIDCFHGIPFLTPLFIRTKKLALIQEVAKEVWFLNHLPSPVNLIVGAIGYVLEPLVFLFYRNIPFMTGSNSAKDDLVKFGIPARNISVIPHGVIINAPKKLPSKEKTKTITFLGTLARDKGVEDAIRAFSILSTKDEFNFWILGSGAPEYVSYLKSLSSRLGVEKKIIFFGFVSEKEKFKKLASSHILVNPSVREGWGLVNIEANAMSTPVVAYKSPGLIDSVKDEMNGILCKENSPKELARQVMMILENKSVYDSLQKGALLWSKRFTWEKSRKKSLKLIQDVVMV